MNGQKNKRRRVIFHRSWTKYDGGTSGGQIKVRDAYNHLLDSPDFEPFVYFGEETVWFDNPGNVWNDLKDKGLEKWALKEGDIVFFSGKDWKVLDLETRKNPPVPIVNIAQPRHIMLNDDRTGYLKHPAIRIAKSSIGKKMLEDYGINGPIYLIPDTIDRSILPAPNPEPDLDILIIGLKYPRLAIALLCLMKLYNWRQGKQLKIKIQIPPKLPTRANFIQLLNRTKIAVFLPLDAKRGAEGFYLPALEGMALKKFVICPYAVGNIDFCIPNETCLQPKYQWKAIYRSIIQALNMKDSERQRIIKNAYEITANHTLDQEKESIINLLHQVDAIWNKKSLFD